jgi:DNA-binding CsgD family transcriptional regulator/Tfp pilus assembly protein PilF
MWGRDRIREEVERFLDAVGEGRGGALFLWGEAGIGKTSHLAEACELARDTRVARAQGDAMESAIAFGLAAQLFVDLDSPGLLEHDDLGTPAAQVRAAKFFGALRQVEARAGEQPLLLAVDDLHWTDPDSLALLSFLCRRIGSLPVGVVATLRPWPVEARQTARNLEHERRARTIQVHPLSEAAAGELLAERSGGPVPEDVVSRAWSVCSGNPLLLEQVALALRRGEAIPPAGARRVAPLSETLLLARFAGVGRSAARYAQAGSVLGISFRPDLAAGIARLDEEQEREAIEALTGTGLLRSGPGGMEFAHPLFAQALYDDMPQAIRRVLHRRAFEALLERRAHEAAAEHAVRADLVGNRRAIDLLARVGEEALATGALSSAVGLLQAAIRLVDGAADARIELALGRALVEAGRPIEAVMAATRALESGDPDQGATACGLLGVAHYAAGAHDEAARCFDRAVALAEAEQPELAVTSLLLHSILLSLTTGPAAALRQVVRARAMSYRVDETLRRRVEATWGYIAALAGDPAGCEAAVAEALALLADGRAAAVGGAWREITMYGATAKYVERFDEAEAIYARSVELTGAAELPGALAALCTGHGETLVRLGRLEDALRVTDRACEVAELATHVTATLATVNRAHVLLLLGREDESEAWCDRAEAMAVQGRGAWLPLLRVWDIRGQRLLGDGAPARAAERYRRAMDLTLEVGLGEPCVVPWAGHAITAHLICGDLAEARRVLAWLEACARRLPCRWPRIAAATGRALLAEHDGDRARAEAEFAVALSLHDHAGLPLERVETLLDWGAFLRRGGQLVRSRPVLAQARAAAEACGSPWLAARARTEHGLAGGRRRRRQDDPDALTPAEGRVARLAAEGLGNREIAEQLWLSVNTVGTHLRRIYAKLGIHSRRELLGRELEDAREAGPSPVWLAASSGPGSDEG